MELNSRDMEIARNPAFIVLKIHHDTHQINVSIATMYFSPSARNSYYCVGIYNVINMLLQTVISFSRSYSSIQRSSFISRVIFKIQHDLKLLCDVVSLSSRAALRF